MKGKGARKRDGKQRGKKKKEDTRGEGNKIKREQHEKLN